MEYRQACRRIEETGAKKNSVGDLAAFYRWLGRPGSASRILHVAGTNGKGSVCAFLTGILSAAGYRVGQFTSPHLVTLRERFWLDGRLIGEETFARLYGLLQERLAGYNRILAQRKESCLELTFFETLFFLFLLWIRQEEPDFVVLEVGMGGMRDATVIAEKPAVTVITKIGLDHCAYLGDTLEQIAVQKAGIFKPGVPAVCWDTCREASQVFTQRAKELSCPLVLVSENEVAFSKIRQNGVDFFMESAYYNDIEARLATPALYQARNAAVAVRVMEQLAPALRPGKEALKAGLSAMRIRARMEEILPGVFLDGANNPDGIQTFLSSVAARETKQERLLLFSAAADKDTCRMAELLAGSGLFGLAAVTAMDSGRSMDAGSLRAVAGILNGKGQKEPLVFDRSDRALEWLLKLQKDRKAEIYIVGSLYLAGEIVRYAEEKREVYYD